jgi:hypothetical protein
MIQPKLNRECVKYQKSSKIFEQKMLKPDLWKLFWFKKIGLFDSTVFYDKILIF